MVGVEPIGQFGSDGGFDGPAGVHVWPEVSQRPSRRKEDGDWPRTAGDDGKHQRLRGGDHLQRRDGGALVSSS